MGDSLGGAELFALFYFMPLYSIFYMRGELTY